MKKILALALAMCLVLALVACTSESNDPTTAPTTQPTVTEKDYKLGMGVVVNTDSSKTGNAQVDATVATVVLDAEGTIVAVDLDVAQSKGVKTEAGVYTAEGFDARTKTEKGPDYGMTVASPIAAEWYTQADAYCAYVVGKVAADLEAIELVEHNGHMVALNEADLYAGCTMAIGDFQAAIADALNNFLDAASSLVTYVGFKLSNMEEDEDHPFGHGRMEYISGLVVSMVILLMGFELGKSSVEKILHPEAVVFRPVVVLILAASILVKFYMSAYNRAVGKKINSSAMLATAADSLSDCLATATALATRPPPSPSPTRRSPSPASARPMPRPTWCASSTA